MSVTLSIKTKSSYLVTVTIVGSTEYLLLDHMSDKLTKKKTNLLLCVNTKKVTKQKEDDCCSKQHSGQIITFFSSFGG